MTLMTHRSGLWLRLAMLAVLPGALASTTAMAQVAAGTQVSELRLDRVDSNAQWRLSQHVDTVEDGAPAQPRGVYVQFGFMGCEPCNRLAEVANEVLGDRVVRVYVHLDDVLLSPQMDTRTLWTDLYNYVQSGPYAGYVTLRRGSSDLMRAWCGGGANPPSALLILPDGTLHTALLSPNAGEARSSFQGFMAQLP
jgi:hypothetical protein